VLGLNRNDFSTRAISKHDSACTNLFSRIQATPPPKKKRKVTIQEEPAATSTSSLEIIAEGSEPEPAEVPPPGPAPPPFTQRPSTSHDRSENHPSEDTNMNEADDVSIIAPLPSPSIGVFLSYLGEEKRNLIQSMHWLTMTALIGSIGTYVSTINSRLKSNRIKQALKGATTEKKASSIAATLARERPADRSTLSGVVDKGIKKQTSQIERRLQSLESRAGTKPQKNAHQGTPSNQLKDRRGAKTGAATPNKSSPSQSTRSRANQKGAGARSSAGGSKGGSGGGASRSKSGQQSAKSNQKKPSKPTKKSRSRSQSRKK
jgi:hypothetical protein